MTHPFRFGVQASTLPIWPEEPWEASVRRLEQLGYDSLLWPDHFSPMWEPTTALAAAAAVTEHLKLGTLVYGVDYRHPVVLAKAAATLQRLSRGRHEFGLGAGWMESDYREAGIPYDRPAVRIERLEEALVAIRRMWEAGAEEKVDFEGRHIRLRQIAQAADLGPEPSPKVLVGGGGPKVLGVAGRHADIVGINPRIPEGRVTVETVRDASAEQTHRKIRWLREAAEQAGRDPDALELNALVFATAITEDPKGLREALARSSGLTVEEVERCPLYLTGPPAEVRETLERRREEFGFSYIVIQARDAATLESFAEHVVTPLAGR